MRQWKQNSFIPEAFTLCLFADFLKSPIASASKKKGVWTFCLHGARISLITLFRFYFLLSFFSSSFSFPSSFLPSDFILLSPPFSPKYLTLSIKPSVLFRRERDPCALIIINRKVDNKPKIFSHCCHPPPLPFPPTQGRDIAEVRTIHCKKRLTIFPSSAGMPLTKVSLVWNNLIISGQGEFGWWHPDWGRENS